MEKVIPPMARRWLNDGKPDTTGRICLEIDPEDGTHPLRVWGRTQEEILEKAAKTVEHGQRTISQLRQQTATTRTGGSSEPNGNGTARTAAGAEDVPPPKKPPLTAQEQMALTADLSDPAKAPAAITRLVEGHTGFDFTQFANQETVKRIAAIQTNWSLNRPDFPKHPINYKLVNDAAVIRAGGYENITTAILDSVFNELSEAGLLVPEEDIEATSPDAHPAETPVTVRRQRGASSYRRAMISGPPPAQASQPKYTQAQISSMSSAEYRRKLESEPGFAEAVAALAKSAN